MCQDHSKNEKKNSSIEEKPTNKNREIATRFSNSTVRETTRFILAKKTKLLFKQSNKYIYMVFEFFEKLS